MAKFVTIGERLSTTAPAVNKAFTERDPEPIIKRAKQQLDAGATYLRDKTTLGKIKAKAALEEEIATEEAIDDSGVITF